MNSAKCSEHENSLLEAFQPPENYQFEWGIFCTHDLNQTDFSELIAPQLYGGTATDERQIQLEGWNAFDHENKVIIFVSADRYTAGSGLPWVKTIPVSGRRLHAKFALLRFKNEKASARTERAVVMSANLTKHGLTSNHEVFIMDDWRGNRASENLIGDVAAVLLDFIKNYASDFPLDEELKDLLSSRLNQIKSKPSGALIHSFGDQGILKQFVGKRKKPAKRVIIISPSFACPTDPVDPPDLSKLIAKQTEVKIYLDAAGRFSKAARGNLANKAKNVTFFRIPQKEEEPRRRLHAKIIVAEWQDGNVDILMGSANYTTKGLGDGDDKNRELMARLTYEQDDLNGDDAFNLKDFLNALKAEEIDSPEDTEKLDEKFSSNVPPINISAILDATRIQGRYICGTLTVIWLDAKSSTADLTVTHGDVLIGNWSKPSYKSPLIVEDFRMEDGYWAITVSNGTDSREIPVHVNSKNITWPDVDDSPIAEPQNPEWDDFLAMLRFTPGNGKAQDTDNNKDEDGKPQNGSSNMKDDGIFRIPLAQRLVLLARYRDRIHEVLTGQEDLDTKTSIIFGDDSAAKECAMVLFAHYSKLKVINQSQNQNNHLLKNLADALCEFDKAKEEK